MRHDQDLLPPSDTPAHLIEGPVLVLVRGLEDALNNRRGVHRAPSAARRPMFYLWTVSLRCVQRFHLIAVLSAHNQWLPDAPPFKMHLPPRQSQHWPVHPRNSSSPLELPIVYGLPVPALRQSAAAPGSHHMSQPPRINVPSFREVQQAERQVNPSFARGPVDGDREAGLGR